MLAHARELYAEADGATRWLQSLRPHICPFESVVSRVPNGSTVLDIGCGAGLLLALLAKEQRLVSGVGFDYSAAAIAAACAMAARSGLSRLLRFEHLSAQDEWPAGEFDAVTMIDVLHHVAPDDQRAVVERCARLLPPGGVFVYKDMAAHPWWAAAANRLHDLVVARQWIHYRSVEEVAHWMAEAGLEVSGVERTQRWCYAHELLVGVKRRG